MKKKQSPMQLFSEPLIKKPIVSLGELTGIWGYNRTLQRSLGVHHFENTGTSCRFIQQKRKQVQVRWKRECKQSERLKSTKHLKVISCPLIWGCLPFIRESDCRRDRASLEGNQKAVLEQCTHCLTLGVVPVESQMNQKEVFCGIPTHFF